MLKDTPPIVYIIMPCYNGEKYLLEQLMSIYYQNYKNWNLIFINDWSTDNSENILRDWISQYNLHNKVKIITKENWGVTTAVQRWLEEVKKYTNNKTDDNLIAYCDADDIRTRDKLDIQVNYMINNPDCGLSYHDLAIINNNWSIIKTSLNKHYYNNESFFSLLCYQTHFYSTEMMFKSKYIDNIIPLPIWNLFFQDQRTALILSIIWVKISYIDKQLGYYRVGHNSLLKKMGKLNRRPEQRLWYLEAIKNKKIWIDINYEYDYFKNRIKRQKKWYWNIKTWLLIMFKYPKIFFLVLKALIYERKLFKILWF